MLSAQSQSPSPSGLSSRGGSWNWMFASMSRMAAMSLFTPWLRSCPAPASSSPSCLMSPCKRAELEGPGRELAAWLQQAGTDNAACQKASGCSAT